MRDAMAKLIAGLTISSVLLMVFFYGACISGLVLREPDICFLLAMGRFIVSSGALPLTDPFSFACAPSQAIAGIDYVIYQWLAECIFYQIYAFGGATLLVVAAALMQTWSFALAPYRYYDLYRVRGLLPLFFVALAVFGSFSHLSIRPEIFTQICLAILLEFLLSRNLQTQVRPVVVSLVEAKQLEGDEPEGKNFQTEHIEARKGESTERAAGKINWSAVLFVSLLSCFWANCHCLFFLGWIILGIYLFSCYLAYWLAPPLLRQPACLDYTVLIALCACVPATLVNPYGLKLWFFLPSLFLNPINSTINELKPLGPEHLLSPIFACFFLLAGSNLRLAIRRRGDFFDNEHRTAYIFALSLASFATVLGCSSNRSVSLALIMLSASLGIFLEHNSKVNLTGNLGLMVSLVNGKLNELFRARSRFVVASWLILSALGALLMTKILKPEIPQGSLAFNPPYKGIDFLGGIYKGGRVLNTVHFGNIMMWHMQPCPKIFLDSRYFLYDKAFMDRYWNMLKCGDQWQDELEKWNFEIIFLDPKEPLSKALVNSSKWRLVFQDESAVIFKKASSQK
jgi:hypothetical protein